MVAIVYNGLIGYVDKMLVTVSTDYTRRVELNF